MRPCFTFLLLSIGLLSCIREAEGPWMEGRTDAITFTGRWESDAATKSIAQGEDGQLQLQLEAIPLAEEMATKTEVVSSLESFYVSATTGNSGEEVRAWENTAFNGDGSYTGGKYWPSSDPDYHFYASNRPLSFRADGCTVSADSQTDVVCAYLPAPTFREANALTFQHIFARIGRLTIVSARADMRVRDVDIRLTPLTSGVYNLRTGAWSGTVEGASTCIGPGSAGCRDNDLYLVPGTYKLSCSWTLDYKGYTSSHAESKTVTFLAGKLYNLTASLGGSVSLPPLTFYCDEAGMVQLYIRSSSSSYTNTVKYNKNGSEWISVTIDSENTAEIPVAAGDILEFGKEDTNPCYFSFACSNRFHVYGDISSLLNYSESTSGRCYTLLFDHCETLEMYENKRLLIPHLSVGQSSYESMFSGCTSLKYAPDLPATAVGNRSYYKMFSDCTSLTEAPAILPATVLNKSCYNSMFLNCTSLERAPELPATSLSGARLAYGNMFDGCTSLNYIKCLLEEYPSSGTMYIGYWVRGVPAGGTFVKSSLANWENGVHGIPVGWTPVNAPAE